MNLHVHFTSAKYTPVYKHLSQMHQRTNAFALAQGCHKTELHLSFLIVLMSTLSPSSPLPLSLFACSFLVYSSILFNEFSFFLISIHFSFSSSPVRVSSFIVTLPTTHSQKTEIYHNLSWTFVGNNYQTLPEKVFF